MYTIILEMLFSVAYCNSEILLLHYLVIDESVGICNEANFLC